MPSSPDRHDLSADMPALFEEALATVGPETAVIPEFSGRHPSLRQARMVTLFGAQIIFMRAFHAASTAYRKESRLASAAARPWRAFKARPAFRGGLLVGLAATPLGLVAWTNTGFTEASLRLRARPGHVGTFGAPLAVAALQRLLTMAPPDLLSLPAPDSAHARMEDARLFGAKGRAALDAEGRFLFLRRQHGLAALAASDSPHGLHTFGVGIRILALATDA